jgi:osmotically inducible protein OsmC
MKEIKRRAQAEWSGDIRRGVGMTSTGSKVLQNVGYSVPSRFERGAGTNPEELIAAAQASCFSMMLSKILSDQHKEVERIRTRATVTMREENGTFRIAEMHLETEGEVKNIDPDEFHRAAEEAKENCPVSQLLKHGLDKITLEATLLGHEHHAHTW